MKMREELLLTDNRFACIHVNPLTKLNAHIPLHMNVTLSFWVFYQCRNKISVTLDLSKMNTVVRDISSPLTLVVKNTPNSMMIYIVGTRCLARVIKHFFTTSFPPTAQMWMQTPMSGHICMQLLNELCLHNAVSTRGILPAISGGTIHLLGLSMEMYLFRSKFSSSSCDI